MAFLRGKAWSRVSLKWSYSRTSKFLLLGIVFITLCTFVRFIPQSNSVAYTTITAARPPLASKTARARLIVMTMDRASSLNRLLKSVAHARYGSDRVDIDIWVDHRPNVALNQQVLNVVHSFVWPYGQKTVYARKNPGGLYAQWLETWDVEKAEKTGEFAVFLEDDLDLSPAFYEWLGEARRRYAAERDVAGFTLQRLNLRPRPAKAKNFSLKVPSGTPVFKFRLQGSWGFAPSPVVWSDFLRWYKQMRRDGKSPYVDNLITTNWYRGQENKTLGYAPTMWTQWFVKYTDVHDLFTVTPWLLDGTTLSANWKEPGLHFAGKSTGRKDYKVFRGKADEFRWPQHLLKIDWDGTVLNKDVLNAEKMDDEGDETEGNDARRD